jgi:hypothetical protein
VDLLDLLGEFHIPAPAFARLTLGTTPAVVRRGGDGKFPEYALNPQVRMLVNERRHLGRVGSSCAAKSAEAVRRTSLLAA